jgi:hypothetical protein
VSNGCTTPPTVFTRESWSVLDIWSQKRLKDSVNDRGVRCAGYFSDIRFAKALQRGRTNPKKAPQFLRQERVPRACDWTFMLKESRPIASRLSNARKLFRNCFSG